MESKKLFEVDSLVGGFCKDFFLYGLIVKCWTVGCFVEFYDVFCVIGISSTVKNSSTTKIF